MNPARRATGLHDACEFEVAIGHVHGEHASRPAQVPRVQRERLARQQVHGHRVAAEGVHGEHVEAVGRCSLETEPGVAADDGDGGRRVAEVPEQRRGGGRQGHDLRIDLEERERVAGPAICGQRAGAESDDADTRRASQCRQRTQRQADAAAGRVVRRREGRLGALEVLQSVQRRAVLQTPVALARVEPLLPHAQRSEEVARREHGVGGEVGPAQRGLAGHRAAKERAHHAGDAGDPGPAQLHLFRADDVDDAEEKRGRDERERILDESVEQDRGAEGHDGTARCATRRHQQEVPGQPRRRWRARGEFAVEAPADSRRAGRASWPT